MGENNETRSGIERRDFLMAAAAAAAGAVHPLALEALDPTFSRWIEQQQEAAPPIPLGQGEHPALVFQASWRSYGESTAQRCSSGHLSVSCRGEAWSRRARRISRSSRYIDFQH